MKRMHACLARAKQERGRAAIWRKPFFTFWPRVVVGCWYGLFVVSAAVVVVVAVSVAVVWSCVFSYRFVLVRLPRCCHHGLGGIREEPFFRTFRGTLLLLLHLSASLCLDLLGFFFF